MIRSAVNVHAPFPFARRIAEHYHKVEISNAPNPALRIMTLQQLMTDANYRAAVAEPPNRPRS